MQRMLSVTYLTVMADSCAPKAHPKICGKRGAARLSSGPATIAKETCIRGVEVSHPVYLPMVMIDDQVVVRSKRRAAWVDILLCWLRTGLC